MKKLVSFILCLSLLFSCSFASTIDFDTLFEDARPKEEIETIELFLDVLRATYGKDEDFNNTFDFVLEYYSNVDIICAILTIKNISKNSLSKAEFQALQREMEPVMILMRDTWYESLKLFDITGTKIIVFCNTDDIDTQRIAEVWWDVQPNSNKD